MAGEEAEVGEGRLGGVEDAHLQVLEGRDVGDELRAREIPRRAAAGEAVLDHPLAERLAADEGGVGVAVGGLERGDVRGRRRRDDAVDHGRGEGGVGGDPVGERRAPARRGRRTTPARTAPLPGMLSQLMTVSGRPWVVRRRSRAAVIRPGRLRGASGAGAVMADVGVGLVEAAVGGAVAVALLGDGDGDDLDGGVGEDGEGGVGRGLRVDARDVAADDAGLAALAVGEDAGVEAVLGAEGGAEGGRADADPGDAPAVEARPRACRR